MALEKKSIVDRIEIIENGCVQVRVKMSIWEDGQEISGTFHRHVIAPGENYNSQDGRVKAVCAAVHTPEVVAAYQAAQAALEAAQANNEV